jgi:tetratricopeptide (TPR) repeat protein
MARTSNATFISYRRETGGIPATALFQRLTASGVDVFLDIESIGSGTFDAIILAQIEVRPYFLLVLTPGTLRRCEEANDWLLREIEHALATGATIVPVHSAHFNFNEMEHFLPPQTWISLRRFNALALPSELSSSWTERLCREFLRPLAMNEKRLPPEHAAAAGRMTQEARRLPVITTNALEAQAQFEEGQVLLVAGEFDRALAQYSAAIRLKPDFADAFYDRGLIRSEKGDHHGAIDDYNQAISLVPRMREAFNARGCAHLAAGDKYSALNDFNEAIRLKADYSKAIKHRAIVYEAIETTIGRSLTSTK